MERLLRGGSLMLLVFALLSCSTEQSSPTGEEARPAPEEVTREVTKVVTVAETPLPSPSENAEAPSAPSPGEAPPPSSSVTQEESPEDVLVLQYRLINAGDYDGAYALFDQRSKALVTPEQYKAYFEANAPYSITDYSFFSVDDRGDDAVVEASLTAISGSGQESYEVTQSLVREGVAWRVVMRDDQASTFVAGAEESAQYDPEASPEPEAASEPTDEETGEIFVRVTGDPGIRFSGNIGTLDGSRSVEGTTPEEFAVEVDTGTFAFDSVSALAQNSDGSGNLIVQIVRDGEVVKEQNTTAQYGVADVTWSPSE